MSHVELFVYFVVMLTTTVTVSVCNYFTDQIMSSVESILWNLACAIATGIVFITVPLLSAHNLDLPPMSEPVIHREGLTILIVSIGSIAGFALAWLIGVTFRRLGWRNYGKWRRDESANGSR
ncbi:MAG TPA: hypothetical protein VL997_15900 [Dyella sp.]|nr:hypothetical protein [Dyella sp.]